MRIRFRPFPTEPEVEPERSLLTFELFQVVAVLVGEDQLAGLLASRSSDEEFALLCILVAARTQRHQKLWESLAALAVALDVMDFQEEVVGAARSSAAVSVAPQQRFSLSFSRESRVGVELQVGHQFA